MKRHRVMLRIGTAFICALLLGRSASALQLVPETEKRTFSEISFDKNNFKQLSIDEARRECGDKLLARISLIDSAASLRDPQRDEMTIAGQIDIHRFFAQYAAVKRTMRFRGLSKNEWAAQYSRVEVEMRPLRERFQGGLHDDASLLTKACKSILDKQQQARVEDFFQQRAKATYSDYIRVTLAYVDRTVPLTTRQRSRITELILLHTDPPKSYGLEFNPVFTVLSKMSEIETELLGEFSDEEWVIMTQVLRAGRLKAK